MKKILTLIKKGEKKPEPISIITQEMIEAKIKELCEMINEFEGSQADAATFACFEIVSWCCDNYYEALGTLTEAQANYREVCANIKAEEEGK